MCRFPRLSGFTLMELLIVVIIVSVLATIAYPVYTSYVIKSRRIDGTTGLMNLATSLESYYGDNNTYVGATLVNLGIANLPREFYNLQLTSLGATTYTITAVPQGSQATQDTQCGSFSLNEQGERAISGISTIADCW
jgi:type IV pilus assembly protein PilE